MLRPAASEVRSLALQVLWTLNTLRSKRRASSEEGECSQSLLEVVLGQGGGARGSSHRLSRPFLPVC